MEFRISKTDFALHASFLRPQLSLLTAWPRAGEALLERLGKYGLQPSGLRVVRGDQANASLGDLLLEGWMFDLGLQVRLKLEGLELQGDKAAQALFLQICAEAGEALSPLLPSPAFKMFSFAAALHGRLSAGTPRTFLSRFMSEAPTLGPLIDAGVSFTYGPTDAVQMSSLLLDSSRLVQDGLFLKITGVWDASTTKLTDLGTSVPRHIARSLGAVDLSLVGNISPVESTP
jgi:hypothetical protein